MLRVAVAAFAALALSACLTPGQQAGIRMQREIERAVAASEECLAPLRGNPDYQPLFRRLAIEPSVPPPVPTAAQLADTGHADRESLRRIVRMHAELAACRAALIGSIARISPDLAVTAVDIWLRGDRMVLSLMRQEVTWGEANRRIADLQREYYRRLAEVTAATRARLEAMPVPAFAAAAEPPAALPPEVQRFPAELAEIHRQMLAELQRAAD